MRKWLQYASITLLAANLVIYLISFSIRLPASIGGICLFIAVLLLISTLLTVWQERNAITTRVPWYKVYLWRYLVGGLVAYSVYAFFSLVDAHHFGQRLSAIPTIDTHLLILAEASLFAI